LSRRSLAAAAVAAASLAAAGPAAAAPLPPVSHGPSTTTNPYVVPVAGGVHTKSILTVGDAGAASNGYEYVGIPDGLGAFKLNGNEFGVLSNHELRNTQGVVRRHGQAGAFVSKLRIDRRTLEVETGRDFINPGVGFWDYVSQTYGTAPSAGGPNPRNPIDVFPAQIAPFSRFCSGTLSEPGQFYDRRTGRGYGGQIYFANEENGDEGRSFGVTEDGDAQQLPRLGLFSWENTVPAFTHSATTFIIGNEDGGSGQLSAYIGRKKRTGSPFERAGLTNGVRSVIDAADQTVKTDGDFRAKYGKGTPAPITLNEVDWDQSGASQNREAAADGLSLNRIEDGAWDPKHPNDLYFLTTEGGDTTQVQAGVSRDGGGLWKLSFEDIDDPELGATLTLLLDGSEAPYLNKPDNLTVDGEGNVLIQEDPGGNAHVARIVAYAIETGARGVLATFDPALFAAGSPTLITTDEESSGIIDARSVLGRGWYLFDAQVHKANPDPALVEEGQLLALKVDDFGAVYDLP
jgi:uncharacterized protein DUF839